MNNQNAKLLQLINNNIRPCVLSKSHPDLIKHLVEATNFLPVDSSLKRRIWHYKNNSFTVPLCDCGKFVIYFRKRTNEYSKHCFKCIKIIEQQNRELVNIEKYGHKSTLTVEEFQRKSKNTILEKYGVEYISQSSEIRNKIIQTNLANYGVENISSNQEIKERKINTLEENYNVKTPMHSDIIRSRIAKTNIERYGYTVATQNTTVQERIKATMLQRYGTSNYSQSHISQNTLDILASKDILSSMNKTKSATKIAKDLDVHASTVLNYMKSHGLTPKVFFTSVAELDIREIFKDFDCIFNDRKTIGIELDIYIPRLKLAIEFNGLYWHSDATKTPKSLHFTKYSKCVAQGIRLITIFENEWNENKELIIDKLRVISGISNTQRIFARKCKIDNVSNLEKDTFLTSNHIQGTAKSSLVYGLYYSNTLVACMAFTKNKDGFLLTRYATSCNVIGGFTKLLTHFERAHDSPIITTFADLRWSNGDVYKNSGFSHVHTIKSDYYWVKNDKLWHKFNWRHKQMKHKLANYDATKSENENMKAHGFSKIWDCGKMKFMKNHS